MAALGLISLFYLTASTLVSAFFFGIAGLSIVLALVELVLARLSANRIADRC